jgi:hypothetical protein
MTTKYAISALGVAATAVALLMTAGCASTGTASADSAGATSSHTSAASGGSGSSSSTSTSGTAAGGGTSGSGTAAGSGTSGSGSLRSSVCATADLAPDLVAAPGGGTAGHTAVNLVVKNESASSCTLQGWPGVSFVGDGNGTQLGAAATFDKTSPHGTVTLTSGSSAHATILVADAQNYGDACQPTKADGFRVYPPANKQSLFAQNDQLTLTACKSASTPILQVQAFQPGTD